MAREDLLLAPESLEALLAGLGELGHALGPVAAQGLGEVRRHLEAALRARADGRGETAVGEILAAMRCLSELASALDPEEAALMRQVAGRFESAMREGKAAEAADTVDTMRQKSGAVKKRGDEFKL
jgi:hypothetical protein